MTKYQLTISGDGPDSLRENVQAWLDSHDVGAQPRFDGVKAESYQNGDQELERANVGDVVRRLQDGVKFRVEEREDSSVFSGDGSRGWCQYGCKDGEYVIVERADPGVYYTPIDEADDSKPPFANAEIKDGALMASVDVSGEVITTANPDDWMDAFIEWIESRGEAFGGSVGKATDTGEDECKCAEPKERKQTVYIAYVRPDADREHEIATGVFWTRKAAKASLKHRRAPKEKWGGTLAYENSWCCWGKDNAMLRIEKREVQP